MKSLSITLFFLFISTTAYTANIYIFKSGPNFSEMVIDGDIEKGDFERFNKIAREQNGNLTNVVLFSRGGDYDEAIKIGNALRLLHLSSMAPDKKEGKAHCSDEGFPTIYATPKKKEDCSCDSACFFIHVGSAHRGGKYLGVHRPYFDKKYFATLPVGIAKKEFSRLQEEAKSYLRKMEVPTSVQEILFNTPSDQISVLEDSIIKKFFWGYEPAIDEWLKSRCPAPTAKLSIRDQLNSCSIKESRQLRADAFQKYFKTKPNQKQKIDINKWMVLFSLVGESFDNIVKDDPLYREHKNENDILKSLRPDLDIFTDSELNKMADINNPRITLHDSSSSPRKVANGILFITDSVSEKLFEQLIIDINRQTGLKELRKDASIGGNKRAIWFIRNSETDKYYQFSLEFYPGQAGEAFLTFKVEFSEEYEKVYKSKQEK